MQSAAPALVDASSELGPPGVEACRDKRDVDIAICGHEDRVRPACPSPERPSRAFTDPERWGLHVARWWCCALAATATPWWPSSTRSCAAAGLPSTPPQRLFVTASLLHCRPQLEACAPALHRMAALFTVDMDEVPEYARYFDVTHTPACVFFVNAVHMKMDSGCVRAGRTEWGLTYIARQAGPHCPSVSLSQHPGPLQVCGRLH